MASEHRPFAIPLLLLAPLPLLLLLLALLVLRLQDERARVSARLDAQAQSVSLALGAYLQGIEGHLRMLSRQVPEDAGEVATFLREARALQQLTGVAGIRLATPAGDTLVHIEPEPSHRPMPAEERQEQPFVVAVTADRAGGRYMLAALVAPRDIRAVVERAGVPAGWDLRIVGPDGREVASPRPAATQTRLASVRLSTYGGWWTHASAPASAVYASVWRSAGRELLLLLLLTVLAPPLAWQLAHSLHRRAGSTSAALQHDLLHEVEARQQAFARELHDGVGSSLAGLGLLLATARIFVSEPRSLELLDKAQEQVARVTQQVREISRGMMPVGQDAGGLLPALDHLASEIGDIQGVTCKVLAWGDFDDVPSTQGAQLFLIAQEATRNALQHGRATHVRILLARAGRRCRLTVLDNGRGCSPVMLFGPSAGLGMRSMRTRAEAIGGRMDVRVQPGRGLRLRITWLAPESGDADD